MSDDEMTPEEAFERYGNLVPGYPGSGKKKPPGKKKRTGGRGRSSASSGKEAALLQLVMQLQGVAGMPAMAREYRFHPSRMWRFDIAFPTERVAVEVDGGIWMQTRTGRSKGHAHPVRFMEDCEKLNEASILGWRVIRVVPEMIRDLRALDWVTRVLGVEI